MIIVYYVSVTSVGTLVTDFTNDQLFGEDGWYLFGIGRSDYEAANDKFVEENIFNHKTEIEAELQKAVDEHVKGSEEILAPFKTRISVHLKNLWNLIVLLLKKQA